MSIVAIEWGVTPVDLSKINADYACFIKIGDELADNAMALLEVAIARDQPDILYSDEAIVYGHPPKIFHFYKPDYSPDMLLSYNYIRNLLCVKARLLRTINIPKHTHYDHFLYEVLLAVLPSSKKITHIDEVLYYHRSDKKRIGYHDFYANIDQNAGRAALQRYCQANGIEAEVKDGRYHGTYHLQYAIQGQPLVSIIIPFKDQAALLHACITSIIEKSTYKNIEIIGIDNGSQKKETIALMASLQQKDSRIQFHTLAIPYNFSLLNNYAATYFAKGEHLLLLNNDTQVIEPSWIEALLEHSQRSDVGVVGAKLLYADGAIQHCGILLGPFDRHAHKGLDNEQTGYFYFPHVVRNYHALTFACVMIKADIFRQLNGLCEELPAAYNDIDFCARVSALGYQNVYTPYAVLYHYESKSRGFDDSPKKVQLTMQAKLITQARHPVLFEKDSMYNKHLTDRDSDFSEKPTGEHKPSLRRFIKKLRRACKAFGILTVSRFVINRLISELIVRIKK